MVKVYLVFSKDGSECVGFINKNDAEQASGIQRLGNPCSTLADVWRDLEADHNTRKKFKMIEIELKT